MDTAKIAQRYQTLLDEIKRRMTCTDKWNGLPALLDEMHALRCEKRAAFGRTLLSM